MGSPLRLVIEADEDTADRAWAALVAEVEAAEAALSRHRDGSELVALARGGAGPVRPSRRLRAALVAAERARRVTGGRFDPRVLADLERLGDVAVPLTDRRRPTLNGPLVLAEPGRPRRDPALVVPAPLDFGGIGKGLALRWGARAVAAATPGRPFLVEAGGDLVAGGGQGSGAGWPVGIEDPLAVIGPPEVPGAPEAPGLTAAVPAEPLAVVDLRAALCTSSIVRRRWRAPDGRPVHHLVDPRTGEPGGEGLLAVTVAHADPAWAEVWSKVLFLAGAAGAPGLARSRGLAAWWVEVDGALGMTPAARPLTAWERPRATA